MISLVGRILIFVSTKVSKKSLTFRRLLCDIYNCVALSYYSTVRYHTLSSVLWPSSHILYDKGQKPFRNDWAAFWKLLYCSMYTRAVLSRVADEGPISMHLGLFGSIPIQDFANTVIRKLVIHKHTRHSPVVLFDFQFSCPFYKILLSFFLKLLYSTLMLFPFLDPLRKKPPAPF